MVKIVLVEYGRSIVPDNPQPNKHVKKYESEHFKFQAVSTSDEETVDDLMDACEKEVLKQHKRLAEKRNARLNMTDLYEERADIEDMLKDVENGNKSFYDKEKLMARKKEIDKLLEDLE